MKKALPSGNTRPNLKVPMAFMCCSERHVNAFCMSDFGRASVAQCL